MSAGEVTVVCLLSGQLMVMLAGLWRAATWVTRIEDRLRFLERMGNGLHDARRK